MAKFTRKEIREIIGEACTDDIENRIMALHLGVVDPMKDEMAKYKEDAEKLPTVQQALDAEKANSYKEKYEKEHSAFEAYKADVQGKEQKAKIRSAYRNLLKKAGINEKRLDTILKASALDGLEIDEKGDLKNADKLSESIKTEWADFIVKEGVQGANTPTPPENSGNQGGQLSRAAMVAQKHYDSIYGKKGEDK